MFITISAEQREHIHKLILPELDESELTSLIHFLSTIDIERNDRNRSQGDIRRELMAAASEIERGLKRLEKLIAEGGASLEAIGTLDYHYSDANQGDLSMVNLSISARETSGTVHSLRRIITGISHQTQYLENVIRQGRPKATRHKHLLLLIVYWFYHHQQTHYAPSATLESPFMRFIEYLLGNVLRLSFIDQRRHVQNALDHFNKQFARTRQQTGPHKKNPKARNQPKFEPFCE